jgi:hypothetical protein
MPCARSHGGAMECGEDSCERHRQPARGDRRQAHARGRVTSREDARADRQELHDRAGLFVFAGRRWRCSVNKEEGERSMIYIQLFFVEVHVKHIYLLRPIATKYLPNIPSPTQHPLQPSKTIHLFVLPQALPCLRRRPWSSCLPHPSRPPSPRCLWAWQRSREAHWHSSCH